MYWPSLRSQHENERLPCLFLSGQFLLQKLRLMRGIERRAAYFVLAVAKNQHRQPLGILHDGVQ